MKAVYCDENVAVSVVDFLHDRGHDVLDVKCCVSTQSLTS